ncbi:MAG: hypothetical protein AAGG08_01105 [Actinomycetota bacterium]
MDSFPLVHVSGTEFALQRDGDGVEFGRADDAPSGVIGLDPDDLGISRHAGTIHREHGRVLLTNRSATMNLTVERSATPPMVVRPGTEVLLTGPCAIEVRGASFTHRITVEIPMSPGATSIPIDQPLTEVPSIRLTENDRRALAAVFEGYLRSGPRRFEAPRSYAEAGALLSLPASTIRKRLERVRDKFAAVDVWFDGANAREQMIAHLVHNGLLDADDLDLLP